MIEIDKTRFRVARSIRKQIKNSEKADGRHCLLGTIILVAVMCVTGCWVKKQETNDEDLGEKLKIYAYSEMTQLLENTVPLFEEKYKCEVEIEFVNRAGDLITKLLEEKEEPQADIVVGINNGNYLLAIENKLIQSYATKEASNVEEKLYFDKTNCVTPISYAYYAILYDTYVIKTPPETFGKMQDGLWKNHLLISDARNSANGLGFLLWSVSMFGERGYGHFWRSIKNNVVHVSATWEQSLDMFLAGEAPFVLAYTTTPALFIETENNYRYKTFIPNEGTYMFIEGVGIVEGNNNLPLAKKFVDFTGGREFQGNIATTLWMYPAAKKTAVPYSYNDILTPENVLNDNIKSVLKANKVTSWIDFWTQIMIK